MRHFMANQNGYILTNPRIIENAQDLVVHLSNFRALAAKPLGCPRTVRVRVPERPSHP